MVLATAKNERTIARSARTPDPVLPEAWMPYWKSFSRSLRATTPPRSERTIKAYGYAVRDLAAFLETPAGRLQLRLREVPDLAGLTRQQLELLFADHNARHDPNYTAI